MASTTAPEVHDLLILVDGTYSMGNYLDSLNQSLPQIVSISALTGCFERMGILAYRDYDCGKASENLLEWSGWATPRSSAASDSVDLIEFASELRSDGGYDTPEACKTGLAKAHQLMREKVKTLILLYTDAPPHIFGDPESNNYPTEQKALKKATRFDGSGPLFADWVSAARTLRSGNKQAHVMCLLSNHWGMAKVGYYEYLSHMTSGACMFVTKPNARSISETTVEILLAWMGVKKEGSADVSLPANISQFINVDGILDISGEREDKAQKFWSPYGSKNGAKGISQITLSTKALETHLPKKATPLQDFAKTYKMDTKYRSLVMTHLHQIIERDVVVISLNPVFGSLWRAVCNDRENEGRQELLDLFGKKVDDIKNADERAKMKVWLEESYDYTAEVLETINSVPEQLRFPCVCLDPTLTFIRAAKEDDEGGDEEDRPITEFRRDELLEIGRSCDYRILRRLGRVLTRLTYMESAEDMPKHIAATTDEEVPKIPMALASTKFKRKFWRILLHTVVPGTLLGGRAAAVLSALAIRLGIQPLMKPAEAEMLLWRDKWNDLEVPETWNISCLSLLMDADKAYRGKHRQMEELSIHNKASLLLDSDKATFERLVEYKMLELNLDTDLTAKVSWTPQQTTMPIGPIARCKGCDYPRSVTIMGPKGVCGLCCFHRDNPKSDCEEKHTSVRVTRDDNEDTNAVWYECNIQTCRAQYVVYHVEGLNVRPKCHYCRVGGTAPTVECTGCRSRIIWPQEYRPASTTTDFFCTGCKAGRNTIADAEVTAKRLVEENGLGWLVENKKNQVSQTFNGRSLFHIASNSQPLNTFCENVTILPGRKDERLQLHLRGKLIQNTPALLEQLYSWVAKRRTESGTCSLCFSNRRKNDLLPACGRSGCLQKVCHSCLTGWYGLNTPGSILNTAALHCPFCRRTPTTKTLARHGTGVHAVGSLKAAVQDSGEWIYAWCNRCGHAKRYMERVCAGGAPDETRGWTCDDCRFNKAELKTKNCPGCGIEMEKASGCDHITCVVAGCGAHWCFFCGKKQDERTIYAHMSKEHGGYFDGAANPDPVDVAWGTDDESD